MNRRPPLTAAASLPAALLIKLFSPTRLTAYPGMRSSGVLGRNASRRPRTKCPGAALHVAAVESSDDVTDGGTAVVLLPRVPLRFGKLMPREDPFLELREYPC
jgi:hypothetical protein